MKALTVLSPIIRRAVVRYNKHTNYAIVDEVVLPTGDLRAYGKFLTWGADVIAAGVLIPLRVVTMLPISCYAAIATICDKLKVSYLAADMRKRVRDALEPATAFGRPYTINVKDIKQLLMGLAPTHTIRRKAVGTFAKASIARGWSNASYRKYKELLRDVDGLEGEVETRKAKLI